MAAQFPHPVNGRVSEETIAQVKEAEGKFGVTEGALVRMAMEDYMPRFLANAGRPQHSDLFAKLGLAIEEKPDLLAELQDIAKRATRRSRTKPVRALV